MGLRSKKKLLIPADRRRPSKLHETNHVFSFRLLPKNRRHIKVTWHLLIHVFRVSLYHILYTIVCQSWNRDNQPLSIHYTDRQSIESMANEKIIEPYRDVNSILSTEATTIQTNKTNLNEKELTPHGIDVGQNVEGNADNVRNWTEPSTPSPTPGLAASYSIFSPKTKYFIVIMTVFGTLFSPFSSFIYITALTPIANSYHRSLNDINFTVTIYQVMQAISPLFFGDLSDQLGRRPVYFITFTIYIAANIGLALQNNYAALMVLRALQSTGCSATVAIGSAVVTDITTSAERGGFITAVQASAMFAPALAPVLGGILTQYLGWRSTFWFLIIAAGIFLLIYVPFVPEVNVKLCGKLRLRNPRLTGR